MPRVSVVIPVYNVERYLRQCLDSVVNQTLRDIEIICVDDGSTDGSAAILAEYAAKDTRLKVISRAHSNAGAARNAGMAVATGEYLGFVDSDDFLGPAMLERMTAAGGKGLPDVVMAGHRVLEDGSYRPVRLPSRLLNRRRSDGECPAWLFLDAGVMPWNKLFKRTFVLEHGLVFQEIARHNDLGFVCCALASAEEFAVSNTCGYVYRRGRRGGITESASGHGDFLFADALLGLRRELDERGLSARAAQAYANLALAHCYYHLLGDANATSFASLYAALHGHLLSDLGLAELDESVFVNKTHYKYMRANLADDSPLSLLVIVLKERYSSWKELCLRNDRISELQKRARESEALIAELRAAKESSERRAKELDRQVSERDRDIDELNRKVKEQSGRLCSVLSSRSYRLGRFLTCPFRCFLGRKKT